MSPSCGTIDYYGALLWSSSGQIVNFSHFITEFIAKQLFADPAPFFPLTPARPGFSSAGFSADLSGLHFLACHNSRCIFWGSLEERFGGE
jgi:hypothetical protein